MDPLTFYRIGLVQHLETMREAENYRLAQSLSSEPSLWQRVRLWLSTRSTRSPQANEPAECREIVVTWQ